MSHKKKGKTPLKKKTTRRRRKALVNEKKYSPVQELERRRDDLVQDRKKLSLENKKKLRLRKLKLYSAVMKLSLPFVVSSWICVGGGILLFDSLPFVVDDQELTKKYSLEIDEDDVIYEEKYYKYSIFEDTVENELEVKHAFVKGKDGTYSRNIEKYTYGDEHALEAIDAVLDDDYAALGELAETTDTLTETTSLNQDVTSDVIKGHVSYIDIDDCYTVRESNFKNIALTSVELFIVCLASSIGFINSDHDIKRKKMDLENEYLLADLTDIDKEIVEIEKKLQKVRGLKK